jgi:hypothetical protein
VRVNAILNERGIEHKIFRISRMHNA